MFSLYVNSDENKTCNYFDQLQNLDVLIDVKSIFRPEPGRGKELVKAQFDYHVWVKKMVNSSGALGLAGVVI
jgi:hypothetical protein